jgi:hypothetical protein
VLIIIIILPNFGKWGIFKNLYFKIGGETDATKFGVKRGATGLVPILQLQMGW